MGSGPLNDRYRQNGQHPPQAIVAAAALVANRPITVVAITSILVVIDRLLTHGAVIRHAGRYRLQSW